jgi:hypothetical protein
VTYEAWFTWIWFGVGFLIWLAEWIYNRTTLADALSELMFYLLFGSLGLIFYIGFGVYKMFKNLKAKQL